MNKIPVEKKISAVTNDKIRFLFNKGRRKVTNQNNAIIKR